MYILRKKKKQIVVQRIAGGGKLPAGSARSRGSGMYRQGFIVYTSMILRDQKSEHKRKTTHKSVGTGGGKLPLPISPFVREKF